MIYTVRRKLGRDKETNTGIQGEVKNNKRKVMGKGETHTEVKNTT